MVWELVATAAAGLNAGAGLQAAMAGGPSAASDSVSFSRFAGRSRMLGLLLSTVSTSACLTAYYGESRGALWLAAAAGVGIGIPFNLLMLTPPTAVVSGGMRLEAPVSPRGVQFSAEDQVAAGGQATLAGGEDTSLAGGAGEGGLANGGGGVPAVPDRASVLSSATASTDSPSSRRRRLMYSKSGMLVSATDLAASWSKKFWFSAALSLTAFGCMMAMLGTGKDAATYGYAPY